MDPYRIIEQALENCPDLEDIEREDIPLSEKNPDGSWTITLEGGRRFRVTLAELGA